MYIPNQFDIIIRFIFYNDIERLNNLFIKIFKAISEKYNESNKTLLLVSYLLNV